MDYQNQLYSLAPIVANTYLAFFVQTKLHADFDEMMIEITEKEEFGKLKDMHSLLACFKAYISTEVDESLKLMREITGQAGYLV